MIELTRIGLNAGPGVATGPRLSGLFRSSADDDRFETDDRRRFAPLYLSLYKSVPLI